MRARFVFYNDDNNLKIFIQDCCVSFKRKKTAINAGPVFSPAPPPCLLASSNPTRRINCDLDEIKAKQRVCGEDSGSRG